MTRDRAGEQVKTQPQKKSSAFRPLYLLGIVLVVIVVALEGASSRFYSSTLNGLENAMREARFGRNEVGVHESEVAKQVHGAPFITQEVITIPGEPLRTRKFYYWPALAGNYRVAITFDEQNRAISLIDNYRPANESAKAPEGVAAQTAAESAGKKDGKPAAKSLPKEGLVSVPTNTVVLDTIEPSIVSTMMKRRCGTIYREIFRQMVLVAARDELGLGTLDASLGEVPFVKEGLQAYALQVDLKLAGDPKTPAEAKLVIELLRPDASGNWFKWVSTPIAVSGNPGLDELLASFEPLSRGELIEGLKQAGFEKSTETVEEPPKLPAALSNRMDFVAQFAQLRHLHAVRRASGETVENLGALVVAYANLGNLIDFHWSPIAKTFKARSLVYAQRMIAKFGATPQTLAHRAYAWALAGNHLLSLRDIEAVQQLSQDGAPEWFPLIHAFCTYEPGKLKSVDKSQKELATYLLMRMIHPTFEMDAAIPVIQDVYKRNPACTRVLRQMRQTGTLGMVRSAAESLNDDCWQEIAVRMRSIAELPDPVKDLLPARVNKSLFGLFAGREPLSRQEVPRQQIIAGLRKAAGESTGHRELSWAALSEILHDFAFVEAEQELSSLARWLGLSPEDVDFTVKKYDWLIESHRFGKYLRSFGSDRAAKLEGLKEIYHSVKTTEYEIQATQLAITTFQANPDFYKHMCSYIDNHWDKLYDELLEATSVNMPTWTKEAWDEVVKISPHYPLAIARRFHTDPEFNQEKGLELEKQFSENRYLLAELGQKYRKLGMRSDAIRCLAASFEIAPTYNTASDLADLYEWNDQTELALEVLQKALGIESHGLENSNAHRSMAQILMRQGKWQDAAPHALAAARSYSGGGLSCAARCSEGLEDWELAEQYIRAMSERYDNSADDWYFWCIRTGRGRIDEARALAEHRWNTFVAPFENYHIWTKSVALIIDDELQGAIDVFTNPQSVHHHNSSHFLMAGLLADRLGDEAKRDRYFDQVQQQYWKDYSRVQFVNLIRKALAHEGEMRWNRESFQELVDDLSGDDVTTLYYCAGEFLRTHGQEELSTEYLRVAATAFNVNCYACTLANFSLRSRGIEVGRTRLNAHPDDRAEMIKHFWRSNRSWSDSKRGEARAEINSSLALNPQFARGLISRAWLNEKEDRTADAVADYHAVLAINPDSRLAHAGLATIYASCHDEKFRDSKRAIEHAQRGLDLNYAPFDADYVRMAAALAESGDFKKAIEFQERALKFNPKNQEILEILELYKSGKPFHCPPPTLPKAGDAAEG